MAKGADAKTMSISDADWRRFVMTFLLVLLGGLAVLYGLIIAIDPYDTGRYPTPLPPGVSDENQQTASASNGRNPAFDAAVFGNSHGMLLSPARLANITGLPFVQMTSPGSGPREQMILMRWFMRHHAHIKAFVLAADQTWCTHDPAIPMLYQFPPWLYSDSHLEYLAHMLNTRSVTTAYRRVLVALGFVKPTDPDGYWDYEAGRAWNFRPEIPAGGTLAPILSDSIDRSFPAITALDKVLAKLPADTPDRRRHAATVLHASPARGLAGRNRACRLQSRPRCPRRRARARRISRLSQRHAGHAQPGEFHGLRSITAPISRGRSRRISRR